jgi:hypothetical protein
MFEARATRARPVDIGRHQTGIMIIMILITINLMNPSASAVEDRSWRASCHPADDHMCRISVLSSFNTALLGGAESTHLRGMSETQAAEHQRLQ